MKAVKGKSIINICTILISIMPFLFISCSSDIGTVDNMHSADSNTGSYAFNILWKKTAGEDQDRSPQALSDCGDIATVGAYMYNESGESLASGTWDCSAHQGTLNNITAGRNRKLCVVGKNVDGYVLYYGELEGVEIIAGRTVSSQNPIVASSFTPPVTSSLSTQGLSPTSFEWSAVPNAVEYRIVISEYSDISDPIVDEIITGDTYGPIILSEGKTYYWVIYSIDLEGNSSFGTPIISFTIGIPDSDSDGVVDDDDDCANTPAGADVNGNGCPDSDGDSYYDDEDNCPNTPGGNEVDTNGCTSPRFTDLGDGTVRDNETNFIWLENANAFGQMNWSNAKNAAANLSDDDFAWLSDGSVNGDWQLPTKVQWESLVCTTYDGPPPLCNTTGDDQWSDGDVFTGLQYDNTQYWSSTEYDANRAWYVRMTYGGMEYVDKTYANAYAWPVRVTSLIPDSGQTACYGTDINEIDPCPVEGEGFFGQDGCYDTTSRSYTKLDSNGDETTSTTIGDWVMVTDNVTGLTWEVKTDDGGIHDRDTQYAWQGAQSTFIVQLNSDMFGGHSDWRMPTAMELSTIVDNGIYDPAINESYFPNIPTPPPGEEPIYWSGTEYASNTSRVWCFDFQWGGNRNYPKTFMIYIRAVRGGQPSPSFTDNGDGTVTHNNTGLMWMKSTPNTQMTWEDGLSYCGGLNVGEYNDWRMPNIMELRSIVDHSTHTPCIDTSYFPDTEQADYWSSTTISDNFINARRISFIDGEDHSEVKTDIYYIRAVRGGQ